MTPPPTRKFTILDAMILIAATAVAGAWWRTIESDIARLGFALSGPRLFYLRVHWWVTPFVESWAATLLVLRLRRPRPRLRRAFLLAGTVACVAATLDLLVMAVPFRLMWWARGRPPSGWSIAPQCGTLIATAWIVLALSGRWRTEPDWIDRLGRVLGVVSITLFLVAWGFNLFFAW